MSSLLGIPQLPTLFQWTPTYNLSNIGSWLVYHSGYQIPSVSTPPALGLSVLIVGLWIVGLIGLAVYLFRRQDILN
jgi:ABC-type transport system involved in multi-copper enzyme maturation permease subunit